MFKQVMLLPNSDKSSIGISARTGANQQVWLSIYSEMVYLVRKDFTLKVFETFHGNGHTSDLTLTCYF